MARPRLPDLRSLLKNSLEKATRIAVLGIGSEFRGDDAAGVIAAERLAKKRSPNKKITLGVFHGATAPENLTGEIRRFKPSHLVIIDTIDAGQKPGTIILLQPDVIGGATFSTHTMPAAILADYLGKTTGCKTVIIGIQGRSLSFGSTMAKSVRESVTYVVNEFIKSL
jgi:hydrogenase 3 maturation protease